MNTENDENFHNSVESASQEIVDSPKEDGNPELEAALSTRNSKLEYDVHRRDDWLHIKQAARNQKIASLKANQRQTGIPT
jgi:hypothetical protein